MEPHKNSEKQTCWTIKLENNKQQQKNLTKNKKNGKPLLSYQF